MRVLSRGKQKMPDEQESDIPSLHLFVARHEVTGRWENKGEAG
jgi:hypothetical protein